MLAASGVNGLLLLLIALVGFGVVIVVAAVVLALIQAVLPGGDTEADALHAEEQKRAGVEPHDAAHGETDETTAESNG